MSRSRWGGPPYPRSRRGGLVALILAGGVLVEGISTAPARADETSLVILLRPPGADRVVIEATTRLEAELRAAGFQVRVIEGTAGADGRTQVEGTVTGPEATPRPASFATIALLATDRGAAADVWVADHITRKTLVRRLDVSDPGVDNAASDLAVRSVELLRASLLEVSAPQKRELPADLARWLGEPPPIARTFATPTLTPTAAPPASAATVAPAPAPRPASAPARAAPSRAVAGVEAGIGVLAGGSFGAAPVPVLRIAAPLPLHLAVRATLVPTAKTELSAAAGTVALGQDLLTIELAYAFGREDATVFPLVAVGGGLYYLRVDGAAKTPYVGEHHNMSAGFFSAAAGLGVRVHEGVALLVDGSALVLQPEPVVTILGKAAGATGRPAFFGSGGVVLDF
jgi:hypothetical protein